MQRRLKTTMRVIQHKVVGRYEIALVDGEPSSVGCVKVPEPRRLFAVIVRNGNRYYEYATPNPSLDLATEAEVRKALEGAALELQFPLRNGAVFGGWTVERLPARAILGKERRPFQLTYDTDNEREIVEFVEGLGVTRWRSINKREPCEVDLQLVKFR